MANDLRLQVIMDLANKATAPLRSISKSSAEAAAALKGARAQLKQLQAQQTAIDSFTKQQAALKASADKVKVLKQNIEVLRQTHGAHSKAVQAAEKALAKQTAEYNRQKEAALQLRNELTKLGVGNVSEAQRRLKTETAAATAEIEKQRRKLDELAAQQKKVDQVKSSYNKGMKTAGQLSSAGVGGMAAGAAMGAPVVASLGAFAQQESATARLQSAMMLANGSISAEYKQLEELAIRLGDKLPGTTADFIDMMRVLKDQGVTAKSILGGTGEAAAYLAVKLRMPVAEAATFAAQMQDATRSTEAEMMSLMDTIQKTNGLGLDSNYMLQGFSKMSPVLNVIKKQGVEAANALAPLLAMMNSAGMTDGGSAGNAIGKVFQAGLDAKKVDKGNEVAKKAGLKFKLNFVNKKGNFAGLDNLYAQLEKIKSIENDQTRVAIIKEVFGDDIETRQVLETMMLKGQAGYQETVDKLQAQADLRQRVNSELTTLSNTWESATGTFTNMLAAIGATLAPQAKEIVDWLGSVAGELRVWISENPVLAGTIAKVVAMAAMLTFGIGALAVSLAAIIGPMAPLKFMISYLGIRFNLWGGAISVVTKSFALLRAGMSFLIAHPVLLVIAAIAAGAYLIYKNWDSIVAFFSEIWTRIKTSAQQAWDEIIAYFASLWGRIIQTIFNLKEQFVTIGGQLMDGLVQGITSRLSLVKTTISDAATSVADWFKEKLGIHSPSRVFMDAGLNIGEGAAIGIERSVALVRTAGAGLAAATAIGMPGMAGASAPLMDARPPLSAQGAAAGPAASGPISITINAAPGMDPQAVARAVSAELDRRDRAQGARRRSTLSDIA